MVSATSTDAYVDAHIPQNNSFKKRTIGWEKNRLENRKNIHDFAILC